MRKRDSAEKAARYRPVQDNATLVAPAGGQSPPLPEVADDQDDTTKLVVHHEVSELTDKLQELAATMLVEGATMEDTFDALNARPGGTITMSGVLNFYRSQVKLQKQRIRRQVNAARALKEALGNPESGFDELADAIFMTGLMRERRNGKFGELQAMREHRDREKRHWQQRMERVQEKLAGAKRQLVEAQTRTELAKAERIEKEGARLDNLMKPTQEGRKLDPEAYRQIREIYGLLKEPSDQSQGEQV